MPVIDRKTYLDLAGSVWGSK